MRGHEHIIAARKRGIKPPAIYVIDFKNDWEPEPTDVVVYGDKLLDLDFRFVFDCFVVISCEDQKRMEWLKKTCKQFGAKQISAGIYKKYYE